MSATSGPSPSSAASSTYGSRAWQTPADSRLMQALVSRCWRADWPRQHLHAGDVDWWTVTSLGRSPGLDERIRLWFAGEPDATGLVGFAWYGPPDNADLIVAPENRGTAVIRPMVDWIEAQIARFGRAPAGRLSGLDSDADEAPATDPVAPPDGPAEPLPHARIWTVAEEAASVGALAELGLEEAQEPDFVHFTGRLDELDLSASPLPDGYRLGTIESDADIAARVVAGHAAFVGSTQTVEKYRFCRSTPLYRPALDTILWAPDGSAAAFALGWLDPLTGGIELEPVGVHPVHQRLGLGRAVCRATLRTARSLGGQQVVIAADRTNPPALGLYGSLGLEITARVVAYRRSAISA